MGQSFYPGFLCRNYLGAGLLFATALALHAGNPVWLKLESKEFVIYSDAREKDVVQSALKYAAFRRAFDELLVPNGGALPTTKLLLFRTEKQFRAHTRPATERNFNLVNFSVEVDGTPLSTFAISSDPAHALQLTFEFETVWGVKRLGYHVPIWMSQGTGGVLSAIDVKTDKVVVGNLGRSQGRTLEWHTFFEVGETSRTYKDPAQLADYLTQARELMHWILLQDEASQARFGELGRRLRDSTALSAVEAVMHTKESSFEKQISSHLRRTPSRSLVYNASAVSAGFRVSPAPEAEVLVLLADLLQASDKPYEANLNLDQARGLAPDSPLVKEAWARRMLREGRVDDAIQLYREAITLGSKNFAAYLRSAVARLEDARTHGRDVAGEGGEAAMIAINELRQAIQLNPGSAEAYRELGRAYYVAPRISPEDISELSRGVFLGEDGALVQIHRAALYQRLGQLDDALNDLRAVLTDPDLSPHNRNAAQQRIAVYLYNRDAKEIDTLVRAKDYAAARKIVQAAKALPECEPAATDYAAIEHWIDENEAWARVVELWDAKQKAEAHAAARAFVQRFPKSPMRREAQKLVQNALTEASNSTDATTTAEP